jgi:hypothetical protein
VDSGLRWGTGACRRFGISLVGMRIVRGLQCNPEEYEELEGHRAVEPPGADAIFFAVRPQYGGPTANWNLSAGGQ